MAPEEEGIDPKIRRAGGGGAGGKKITALGSSANRVERARHGEERPNALGFGACPEARLLRAWASTRQGLLGLSQSPVSPLHFANSRSIWAEKLVFTGEAGETSGQDPGFAG